MTLLLISSMFTNGLERSDQLYNYEDVSRSLSLFSVVFSIIGFDADTGVEPQRICLPNNIFPLREGDGSWPLPLSLLLTVLRN
jgi:hypothetical protein